MSNSDKVSQPHDMALWAAPNSSHRGATARTSWGQRTCSCTVTVHPGLEMNVGCPWGQPALCVQTERQARVQCAVPQVGLRLLHLRSLRRTGCRMSTGRVA